MRFAFILMLLYCVLPAKGGEYKWADCAKAHSCSYKTAGGKWQTLAADLAFCYDTYAFRFSVDKQWWFTGLERYSQHLEDSILVEQFISQPNPATGSEFSFHILRSKPAVITITRNTGEVWVIRSVNLSEVKLGNKK